MSHVSILTTSGQARQQDEKWRIGGQAAVVAGDPVESHGAAVLRPEALAAEPDVGDGAEEGGKDGFEVAVGGEEGERAVGARQVGEGRQETVACAAEDFEGRVGGGGGSRHGCGGG